MLYYKNAHFESHGQGLVRPPVTGKGRTEDIGRTCKENVIFLNQNEKSRKTQTGVNKKPFACPFQDRQFQNP